MQFIYRRKIRTRGRSTTRPSAIRLEGICNILERLHDAPANSIRSSNSMNYTHQALVESGARREAPRDTLDSSYEDS